MNFYRFLFVSAFLLLNIVGFAQVNASFTVNSMQGCVPLAVSFANTSTGSGTLTYKWNFGNGSTATIPNPGIIYTSPGTFIVSLIVSNGTPANNDTAYLTIQAYRKPVVNFTSGTHVGCNSLTVTFSDISQSVGATINGWSWAFGDGGGSTQQNPTHTYSAPGTYSVYLRVTNVNGCSSDTTIAGYVIVSTTPTNSFTADVTNKCIPPLSTNFTGTAQGNGTLTYSWNFGDGGAATTQNASHTYNSSGHFNVSFTATDQYGCTNTTTQNSYINVTPSSMPPPTIQYTANITASCDTPLSVNFTNTSQGNAPLSYVWHFGDGSSSTLQNPTNIYHSNGNFNVSLIVTDVNGCSDSLYKSSYINISQIHASFTITGGDTACVNEVVNFVNTTGTPNSFWIYGNGSSGATPSTSYTTSGYKTIKMIAEPGTSCADTVIKAIYISPLPNANFSTFNKYGCKTPHTANFVSSGSNITSWNWNFGDNGTSTTTSPSHQYLISGNFVVSLLVTNISGCQATKTDTVYVNPPVAHIFNDTNRACIPLPIYFEDNSTCNTHFDHFVSWLWKFGDGTPNSTQQDSITHLYNIDGDFWASLTVTTSAPYNCVAKDSVKISVGSHQNLNFLIDHVTACAQDSIKITNLTTDLTKIDTCFWTFGPVRNSILNHPLPFVLHNTVDTGFAKFQLITTYNGCRDTLLKDSSIYIKGPIIKTVSIALNKMHCDHDSAYVYYLTTNTQAAHYWAWNWRDSTLFDTLTADTARHKYLSTGNRLVRVWAHNDSTGCTYRDSLTIKPRDVRANFNVDDTICYTGYTFTGIVYKDAVSWKWSFGDGSPQTAWGAATSTHVYDTAGIYNLKLYTKTDNELQCTDSVNKPIRVFRPEVNFYGDTLIGCAQTPITVPFHNTSFSPGTKINIFNWTYGDGITTGPVADSIPVHPYPIAGKYNVTLLVTDSFGCVNSLTKNNYVASLEVTANFHPSPLNNCTHAPVTFTSTSTAIPADYPPVKFHWYFGNADTSYAATPTYNYDIKGNYVATLIVFDTLGCSDTLKNIIDTIRVQDIVATFTADTFLSCYTQDLLHTVNLTEPAFSPVFLWKFGDGDSSSYESPVHQYAMPGEYDLILKAYTSFGCFDSDTVKIIVDGPFARISIDTSRICKGDLVTFSLDTAISVFTYQWFFGDGESASNVSPATHQYNYVPPSGLFFVTMLYNSPAENCPQTADTLINIYQVIAGFSRMQQGSTPGDTSGCTPLPIVCTESSTGATFWNWNFGDGATSNVQTPAVHSFVNTTQNNKTYDISLIIRNNIGCKDTANWSVVVNPKPDIFISNDTTICRGTSIPIHALGGSTVTWTPAANLSSTNTPYTIANPNFTTTYTALIQSNYGCSNSDTIRITVQQTPQLTTSRDTTIIVGEYVDLIVTSDIDTVTYTWIPELALSCGNCPNPTARPMTTTNYIIRVQDEFGCPYTQDTIIIKVRNEFSVDVPTIFTPNGDGHNETIFVKGWGIKKMNLFKVFNRWGQLVFETDDIKLGWDGIFNGKMQPADTYTYYVEVDLFDGNQMNKKGTFNLLR